MAAFRELPRALGIPCDTFPCRHLMLRLIAEHSELLGLQVLKPVPAYSRDILCLHRTELLR